MAPAPTSLLAEFPGGEHDKHEHHTERLQEWLKKGQVQQMVDYLDELKPDKSTAGFKLHLGAVLLETLGETRDALEHCDAVRREYPDYVPARLMRSRLMWSLGRDEEGLAELEATVKDLPGETNGWLTLANTRMALGEFDEARATMERALEAGVSALDLEATAFRYTRALYGPEWPEPFEYSSRNYHVNSDLSYKHCTEASKVLEQALAMYNRILGRADSQGDAERYEVYLFSGSAGYQAYASDLLGTSGEGTAGLYSPVLKQLLIWNLPDKDMMTRTVRHEGFHQYLDSLVEGVAPWFNEGMAEYFETAAMNRSRMTPGDPVVSHVTMLNDSDFKWLTMKSLIHLRPSQSYRRGIPAYGQAWATLHFLLHTGRPERALFDKYFEALLAGATPKQAAQRAFEGEDLRALNKRVREHVKALGKDL